jgi:membrane protein required for colicin V production
MNWLDFIILTIVALLVINGVRKGFIISLASLIALALGIYIAINFSNYLDGVLIENLNPSRKWLPILSFTITFLVVVIVVMIIAKALEKVVDLVGMGILNRIAGGILGFIKGILFVSVLAFIISSYDPNGKLLKQKDKKESMIYGYVDRVLPFLLKLVGGEIRFPAEITK